VTRRETTGGPSRSSGPSVPMTPGIVHFRDGLGVVLAGLPHDTTLVAYLDYRIATGTATLLRAEGGLGLEKVNPGSPLPP
jgi:hypothetical protein